MGFAIQRGGTCTVAAMEELLLQRRGTRFLALLEASLWVAGGLASVAALQRLGSTPAGFAVSRWTVVGGALLGLGAFVNGACVFGAIARFGSGDWVYLSTPLGFYIGCLTAGPLFTPMTERLAESSPVLQLSLLAAAAFAAFAAWRLWRPLGALRRHVPGTPLRTRLQNGIVSPLWSPHAATTVIGIAFLLMFLLVGAWAYTDVLAEAARGTAGNLRARSALLLALFAGAAFGGWSAGLFRHTRLRLEALLRCLAGGALMGWGSLLIPGSNDGLLLLGLPLLWPYAYVAVATMCVSIGLALLLRLRWQRRRR
ncbi:MAG: YeeE/YedE family protein [Pseudomonadota bacterium]|nr:YeeE/YedE family protein [Pseudomonadota bacterium]